MRIRYTVPAIGQPTSLEGPSGEVSEARETFTAALHRVSTSTASLRESLALSQPPLSGAWFEPPPRPGGVEPWDLSARRLNWKTQLRSHQQSVSRSAQLFRSAGVESTSVQLLKDVELMVTLLLRYQQLQDQVSSRALIDTRS